MDLKNKIAVVTGATGGIGREIVKKLDEEGAQIILVSKNETELQNLLQTLRNKISKYYVCDFNNQEETEKVAKNIADEFNKIDLLINSAGIGIYKTIEEISLDEWNMALNINLNSVFIMTKELISSLSGSKKSMVINMGSGSGLIPIASRSSYCTSKFALRGLTLSLAEEFKRFENPKFVLINLGSVLTGFGPLSYEEKVKLMESGKYYITPEWVANQISSIILKENPEIEYDFLNPGFKP
ncbi:MAG: SDR family oxidoreductase [Microgenomates group bacterium]